MTQPSVLRLLRERVGETVTSMAAKLDIGISRYWMIESGTRPATPELADKIAKIVGTETAVLFLPQSFTVREHATKEVSANG